MEKEVPRNATEKKPSDLRGTREKQGYGIECQKSFKDCVVQWFPNLSAHYDYLGNTLKIQIASLKIKIQNARCDRESHRGPLEFVSLKYLQMTLNIIAQRHCGRS